MTCQSVSNWNCPRTSQSGSESVPESVISFSTVPSASPSVCRQIRKGVGYRRLMSQQSPGPSSWTAWSCLLRVEYCLDLFILVVASMMKMLCSPLHTCLSELLTTGFLTLKSPAHPSCIFHGLNDYCLGHCADSLSAVPGVLGKSSFLTPAIQKKIFLHVRKDK